MRVARLVGFLVLMAGAAACGNGTYFASNGWTPGGVESNATPGRRGFGIGVHTTREEIDTRGVACGKPTGEQTGPVLYSTHCQ